eukprot:ANDGO_04113.mRNA.1 Protein phosphatase 2C homolog 1
MNSSDPRFPSHAVRLSKSSSFDKTVSAGSPTQSTRRIELRSSLTPSSPSASITTFPPPLQAAGVSRPSNLSVSPKGSPTLARSFSTSSSSPKSGPTSPKSRSTSPKSSASSSSSSSPKSSFFAPSLSVSAYPRDSRTTKAMSSTSVHYAQSSPSIAVDDDGNGESRKSMSRSSSSPTASGSPTSMEACAVCEVGFAEEQNARFRRTMEDAHTIKQPFNKDHNAAFLAIYDGHGGEEVARMASTILDVHVQTHLDKNKSPLEALQQAHLDTDADLKKSHDKFSLTGSTSAVAYVRGRSVYAGNVGDARVVLLPERDGTAVRMTVDHKGSLESEALRVRENGGLVLNGRVNAMLLVTRALGDFGLKKWVIAEPHVQEARITGPGGVLVVACDGVWDVMEDQEVCELIVKARDQKKMSATEAAQYIMKCSLERGSTDNISIIVAYLR